MSIARGGMCLSVLAGTLLAAATLCQAAAPISWDRPANIKDAAKRLAEIQIARGAAGTYKFITACYGTHTIAEKFTAGLEACIAQDYMLTEVLATIYARVPAEKRREMKAVEPEELARGLSQRVGTVLSQYKMTEQEGLALKKLVDEHGLPIFAKATLPKH